MDTICSLRVLPSHRSFTIMVTSVRPLPIWPWRRTRRSAPEDFRTLDRYLDEAIASAVTMYMRESQQSHSDKATIRDNERVGFLVHEMRNLVNTAVVAFEVLKSGNVAVGGSLSGILNRTLMGLRDLIAGSLEDIRSTSAVKNRKRILVSDFIAEIGAAAALEADARGLKLIVAPVQEVSAGGGRSTNPRSGGRESLAERVQVHSV